MGFAKAMGEFGATITFVANIPGQTQTLPSAIWAALQIPGGEDQAVSMVLMSSAIAVSAVLLSELLARRVAKRIAGT
jgi:molybdate transport system permease protein